MDEIKVENDLRLLEVKRENLYKAMETVKSQWRDAEDYLKFSERKVEKRLREVEVKEKELENRSFALEEREKVAELAKAEVSDLELKSDGLKIEIEEKRKELDYLKNQVKICLGESNAEEVRLTDLRKSVEDYSVEEKSKKGQLNMMGELLRNTQAELELKGEQLAQLMLDLERHRVEVSAEKEHLGRTQTCRRQLEGEIESKKKDLTFVSDKFGDYEKLFELRSLEHKEIQGELKLKGKQLEQLNIDIEKHRSEVCSEEKHLGRIQDQRRELEDETERKRKDLMTALDRISECGNQLVLVEEKLDSQLKLIETRSSELISKEKELELLSQDTEMREEIVKSLNEEMEVTCQQMKSKAKELEEIQRLIEERRVHYESIKILIEEHTDELASKEKKHDEITQSIRKLSSESASKARALARDKLVIEELSEKQLAKEKKLNLNEKQLEISTAEILSNEKKLRSVKDALRECQQNLKIKEKELMSLQSLINERNKHLDHVQSSISDLTAELKSKECDLFSVKKKIQDNLKDLNSKEEQQVISQESLMERVKKLELKEKELDAHSEKNELKEKELDARLENIDGKEQQLKSMEEKLAKRVKDHELKSKKMTRKQSNPDQHVNLVQDVNVSDEKTLQLLLNGHLKKCPQLHFDVLCALKASSDPAKLVLDTIKSLYAAHQRMSVTSRDPNGVRRSSMCLLECLMDMSTKPKTEVQGEAIKFAIEWKKTTLVNAENPLEVLGFLHFLAAFSLTYTFDADKVQNVFDVAFLRKYAPSLCEALGVSALASVNNVLSLDDKPEQQHSKVPITNSSDSQSRDIQEIITSSPLANEDALMDLEGSTSFAPNEVSIGLPLLKDPGRYVLNAVEDELMGAQQRGELGLAEPIVKALVPFFEELPRLVNSTDPHLKSYAKKVAHRWSGMMRASGKISPLEAWGFLQFIVVFGLVDLSKRDETSRFASYVAHFRYAPKLFQSLGLTNAMPNFVEQLQNKGHYIKAIRYMFYFNLRSKFTPLEYLQEEIINLKRSAKENRRFESQVEDRDAGKLRDIIELIDDFKLEIDLPVDLILKFMVPRETQTQNQCDVSLLSVDHMQASQMAIHSSYTDSPHPTSFGVSQNQQLVNVETYQAGGSALFEAQSSNHVGFKRPRVDPKDPRSVIRPCLNPSEHRSDINQKVYTRRVQQSKDPSR